MITALVYLAAFYFNVPMNMDLALILTVTVIQDAAIIRKIKGEKK